MIKVNIGEEMSVNPFYSMRARYFLIVFTLLIWLERSSKQLLEHTLHIQNSSIINLLIFYILPVIWLMYEYRRKDIPLRAFINRQETFHVLQVVWITVMLCLFSYGYLILYMYSFTWITPDFIMTALHQPIIEETGGYVYQFITVVFIAPIIGEFVFRGFLFQRFAAKWGTGKGMIAVAILFGCVHIDFLGATVFSIVLSIVYIRSKSLLMPISIHMLNNGVVLIGSKFMSKEEAISFADLSNYTNFFTGFMIFIIGLNFVLFFLFMNRRYMNEELPIVTLNKM